MQARFGVEPAQEKKKVLVVGGGPAGMEAAITAAQRGHDVTLVEKQDHLGGNLIPAGSAYFKGDYLELAKVLEKRVYENGVQHVFLDLVDVSEEIRSEKVGNMASTSSALAPVRAKLLDLQRDVAAKNDVIMDGRDIGTNILPNAELKIYLTASVDVRAKRRYDELKLKGESPDLEEIKKGIEQRDYQDMNRDIAPLKQAEDAVFLDTSDMTISEVVDEIIRLKNEL